MNSTRWTLAACLAIGIGLIASVLWSEQRETARASERQLLEACGDARNSVGAAAFAIFALERQFRREGALPVQPTEARLADVLAPARAAMLHLSQTIRQTGYVGAGLGASAWRENGNDVLLLLEWGDRNAAERMENMVDWAVETDAAVNRFCDGMAGG